MRQSVAAAGLLLSALLASFASSAYAQAKPGAPRKPPKDYIRWVTRWSDALSEAGERNVPIVVAVHEDG